MSCLSRPPHRCFWVLMVLVAGSHLHGQARLTEGRSRESAEAFLDAVKGYAASPPGWQSATVSNPRPLFPEKPTWRVCDVSRDNGRGGYILLFESSEKVMPVMYSASDCPSSVLGQVASPAEAVGGGVPPHVESLPDVTMIALPRLRSERTQVTPFACCVASMSMWVQERHRIPLLFLPQEAALSTTRPFDTSSPLLSPSPPPSIGELSSFHEQRSKIYEDPALWEPMPENSDTQPAPVSSLGTFKRSKDSMVLIERMRPVLHSELMKDLSRAARWELMDRWEFSLAADILARPFSTEAGMVSAIVIQSYLTNAPNLEQGLEDFARSRGMRSPWLYSRGRSNRAEDSLCLVWTPRPGRPCDGTVR